jgi:hypothetical protein
LTLAEHVRKETDKLDRGDQMASGLTDMEELLERIPGGEIKGFMREALVCYGAGAHRACIVLSFIAVFEDLRAKVKVAANLNNDAKAISKDIEKQAEGQKPFETDLVNRLASKNLLSALQSKRLLQMIDYRNKAAHPSGHYASAEEARFVYFEAIDSYLCKPLLSADDFAKAILERLKGGNYFPDNSIANISNAVEAEIEQLNPAAYLLLIGNLVAGVTDADPDFSKNCRMFLTGLAAKKDPRIRDILAKQLVKAKAINSEYNESIAVSIAADAQVLRGMEPITRVRVNALLVKWTKDTKPTVPVTRMKHPLRVLIAMTNDLEEAEIFPDYTDFVQATAAAFWWNVELTRALKPKGGVRDIIIKEYLTRAGSSEFATANTFAKALPDLDNRMSKELSSLESLTMLAAICNAADTGAWDAQAMRNQKFATVPKLRAAALQEIDKNSKKGAEALAKYGLMAAEFKNDWLGNAEDA